MDVSSGTDERQDRGDRLANQTGPDADNLSVSVSDRAGLVQARRVPVNRQVRHPHAAAKAHTEQRVRGFRVYVHHATPVCDICELYLRARCSSQARPDALAAHSRIANDPSITTVTTLVTIILVTIIIVDFVWLRFRAISR